MKKLTRSRDEKWLGGVCGGLSEYSGVDVTLIRVVLAVLTVLGAGSLLIAYVVAWAIIPQPTPGSTTPGSTTPSEPAPPWR